MLFQKPNFFCIGAQKTGTTTLHEVLIDHPDIYLPIEKKELHFFDDDDNFLKGVDWYLNKYFSQVKTERAIGEITPAYCFYEVVPKRIYDAFGADVKFIFILRNPIDRAISQYNMNVANLTEGLTFYDALENEKQRLQNGTNFEYRHYSYLDRGYYSIQIERYLQFFKSENLLLLNFEEEFLNSKSEMYKKIQSFLNIEPWDGFDLNKHSNKADVKFKYGKLIKLSRKYPIIHAIINHKLPKKIVRPLIEKTKKKEINKKFILNPSEKNDLLIKYYSKEIKRLNSLTNNSFINWL